jgi:CheY-like chemotaxis protein
MFWQNHFDVLLVDDEPDVLAISKLSLKHVRNLGVPLKLHTAGSKKEALELLHGTTPSGEIAAAVIDVVMETEHAGLELCHFIRRDRSNRAMQLIIRTGQPGKAPERTIIDSYDINSYITKTEVTEDRLYCLIKAAIKQWLVLRTAAIGFDLVTDLIGTGRSAGAILAELDRFFTGRILQDLNGRRPAGMEAHQLWYLGDEERRYGRFEDATIADEMRARLAQLPGRRINDRGDEFVQEGHFFLLRPALRSGGPEAGLLAEMNFVPPDFMLTTYASVLNTMSSLLAPS